MRTLIAIIVALTCSQAHAWNWMQERANCANGQCVASPKARILSQPTPLVKETLPVVKQTLTTQNHIPDIKKMVTDCPDGRCPLLPKQGSKPQPPSKGNTPTLAPPEPQVQAKPLRSVMVQPVRRAFQWRPFKRLFGRR